MQHRATRQLPCWRALANLMEQAHATAYQRAHRCSPDATPNLRPVTKVCFQKMASYWRNYTLRGFYLRAGQGCKRRPQWHLSSKQARSPKLLFAMIFLFNCHTFVTREFSHSPCNYTCRTGQNEHMKMTGINPGKTSIISQPRRLPHSWWE